MPKAGGASHPAAKLKAGDARYSLESSASGRHAQVAAHVSSPLTDGLKFRLVQRAGKHYFKNVRFKCPSLPSTDVFAVTDFFEGRCLENLTREALAAWFGHSALLSGLQDLIADLQQILCD